MIFKTNPTSKFFISNLLLLSICVGFFLFSPSPKDENLVYCPLQKAWVKKEVEVKPHLKNPLDEICMSDSLKQKLTVEITLKQAFSVDEKGVFETLQKGSQVLEAYQNVPNLPQQNLAEIKQSNSFLTSSNEIKIAFITKKQAFSFALNSRPPTVKESVKFDFQTAQSLETISRNINPRSPPFSI